MSKGNFMTIREFRDKFNLPINKAFSQAVTTARIHGWKGLRIKTRFSQGGEYAYPEQSLKKIARALQMPLSLLSVSADRMMTVAEFRTICHGLSSNFASNVARYSSRYGLVQGERARTKRYPFSVLKRFAEHEGHKVSENLEDVPTLPGSGVQGELCLGESEGDGKRFCAEVLEALKENNSLLRELLKVWKGDQP